MWENLVFVQKHEKQEEITCSLFICCCQNEKGETKTKKRNNVTPDVILKDFWEDKERFADLFNAALFDGEEVLKPENLNDASTDKSSVVKIGTHADTVKRVLDVVKKTANGVDFVIFGIENQQKIHYAMPLRHLIGDALSYFKEYKEIEKKNTTENTFETADEFLAKFKKTDRLHPMISICVYYGDDEWDGPLSLKDMLEIPDRLESAVADYEMHLLEVRKSGALKFKNKDVETMFEITRMTYDKEIDKVSVVYDQREIDIDIFLAAGAITNSQKMIDQALEAKKEGTKMTMCKALQEWEDQCTENGRREGWNAGLESGKMEGRKFGEAKGIITTCIELGISPSDIIERVKEKLNLSEQEATDYYNKFTTV